MTYLQQSIASPAAAPEKAYSCPPGVLFGMCIGVSIYWLFALSMNPMVPSIARDLGLALGVADPNLSLAVSMAGLTAGICIMPMGGLADQFGRMRLTRIGLAVGLIGALLCGLAPSIWPLVAGRFLLGLSASIVMPATLGLVKVYYNDADRPRAITYWSLSTAGCASFSSLFGGIMATHVGWRWAFLLAVPCILVAFFLLRTAPERKAADTGKRPFDLIGFSALIIGLLALNLFISKGKAWGWTSMTSLGCLGLFALALAVFVPNEKRNACPIADLSLFNRRAYTGSVVANLFVNSLLGVVVVIMIYLQKGRGLTAMQASLLTLGYATAVLTLMRVGEKVGRRMGPRFPMVLGCLSLIGLVLPLACTFVQSNAVYLTLVFFGLAFLGVGLGLFMTPATTVAIGEAPAAKAALAGGIFKMGSSLGGAFGIAVHLAIFGAVLQTTKSIHLAVQYSIGFGLVAALLASGVSYFLTPSLKH